MLAVIDDAEELVRLQLADARALERQGDHRGAERAYEQILRESEQKFGLHSRIVASVLVELSAFYATADKPCSAKQCCERANQIMHW